jgi:hypothetical protein
MLECVPVASARLLWARSAGCRGSSVLNYMPRAAGKMGARRVDGIARRLVPAICDVSVTNVCNATCDFCAYAHDKGWFAIGAGSTGRAWLKLCLSFIAVASVA